jgi:hypothetical protein
MVGVEIVAHEALPRVEHRPGAFDEDDFPRVARAGADHGLQGAGEA